MFTKILIANRGEIACRVIRTARAMGIATVAVYSDADARALHVRLADEAVRIGGPAARDSYLRGDIILDAAKATGAQAIHPGYGFLSENAAFATACAAAGIVFIGPPPAAIEAMGLKDRAKAIMAKAGVPVVPGYQGEDQKPDHLKSEAGKIGYPILIKAVAGGGGKGMRLVERAEDFAEALASCQREAAASFGNGHVLIEKYITRPRHIEMQVFGDSHGNAVHLFERDCSLQRRHQKVVEEAPAPGLSPEVRAQLGTAAVRAVKAIGYTNAGTLEFIMDAGTQDFYFMEMNTRLQVEHPVTEEITGLDLVEWQLRIAAGEKLPLTQDKIQCNGHAFEVRLYAEDPANEFLPQTGRITDFFTPANARVETGIAAGDEVTIFYDPMIAKLIVHAATRADALAAMRDALAQTGIAGLRTNQEFLSAIFAQPDFAAGRLDTGFIPRHLTALVPADYGQPRWEELSLAAAFLLSGPAGNAKDPWAGDGWRLNGAHTRSLTLAHRGGITHLSVTRTGAKFTIAMEDITFLMELRERAGNELTLVFDSCVITGRVVGGANALTVFHAGRAVTLTDPIRKSSGSAAAQGQLVAPMPGRVIAVLAKAGDTVAKNQPLLVMEAMKMEMSIRAPVAGTVETLTPQVGDQVADGALLAIVREAA